MDRKTLKTALIWGGAIAGVCIGGAPVALLLIAVLIICKMDSKKNE